jgi:hypothetical protein
MGTYSPTYSTASEVFGTRHENYDDELGLMSADVTLRIEYALRHLLVQDVCGNRRPWPNGAAGKTPLATQASIVPEQSVGSFSGQTIEAAFALVTIHYTTKVTDVISESLEPTAEFATLDHRWFRWGSGFSTDELREEEAPGVLKRGMNLVRHIYDVIPPLSTDLVNLVGSTNEFPYVSALLEMTFDTDTLLFAPPVINRKVDSLNIVKYDIEKKFTYNPFFWNTFFRSKTGSFQNIYVAGASTPYIQYPLANFSNILP